MIKAIFTCTVAAIAMVVALAPANAAFTLNNSNGGDGFVTPGPAPYLVTLFGSNNGAQNNVATFTDVAASARNIFIFYRYHTDDVDGAAFDKAGIVVNGTFFQLSPPSSPTNFTSFGTYTYHVAAGDTYGLYVDSTDGVLGRGSLSVGVPEPASWALLIAGFGMVGAAARRRRSASVAA